MSLARQVWRDALAMIGDCPQTFTFDSVEHTGTLTGLNKTQPMAIGGFEDMPELTLVTTIRDESYNPRFVNRPTIGSRITIENTVYRVERTEIDPFAEVLQLDLKSKDK